MRSFLHRIAALFSQEEKLLRAPDPRLVALDFQAASGRPQRTQTFVSGWVEEGDDLLANTYLQKDMARELGAKLTRVEELILAHTRIKVGQEKTIRWDPRSYMGYQMSLVVSRNPNGLDLLVSQTDCDICRVSVEYRGESLHVSFLAGPNMPLRTAMARFFEVVLNTAPFPTPFTQKILSGERTVQDAQDDVPHSLYVRHLA